MDNRLSTWSAVIVVSLVCLVAVFAIIMRPALPTMDARENIAGDATTTACDLQASQYTGQAMSYTIKGQQYRISTMLSPSSGTFTVTNLGTGVSGTSSPITIGTSSTVNGLAITVNTISPGKNNRLRTMFCAVASSTPPPTCQYGACTQTTCSPDGKLQTCTNGCYNAPTACTTEQTCTNGACKPKTACQYGACTQDICTGDGRIYHCVNNCRTTMYPTNCYGDQLCKNGGCTPLPATGLPTVSPPTLVIPYEKIPPINLPWAGISWKAIDSSLVVIKDGTTTYWLDTTATMVAKFRGTATEPFQTLLWSKPTAEVFTGSQAVKEYPDGTIQGYWIVNTYQDETGVLAFIHVEHPTVKDNAYYTGRGRVGLAWSADFGEHFTYLGDIIIPYGDTIDYNVEAAPYIIKDGYFYVYYKDPCSNGNMAVARAPVADVLAAARAGTVTPWKKYRDGAWNSDGLGGACTAISVWGGITHTDAVYSSYTNKYYLLISKGNYGGETSWIKLHESTDGITWTYKKSIVEEEAPAIRSGYQYVTITDENGNPDNGVVGKKFFVYSVKDPGLEDSVVYRWTVDLSGEDTFLPPPPITVSSIYSSTQGTNGLQYQYGDQLMTWAGAPWDANAKLWKGDEAYALIAKGWMHPGANSDVNIVWTATRAGTIEVTGTAKDNDGKCGDGVDVGIDKNGEMLWSATLPNNDVNGKSHATTVDVALGDRISFTVDKHGDNYCDSTAWDPTIRYTTVR